MIGFIIVAVIVSVLFYKLYKNAYERPPNFPPGPPKLPIWGAYWFVLANGYNDLPTAMKRLAKQYKTNIVGMYLGKIATIVLNDPDLIKEMLNRHEFDGRVDMLLARLRSYWKKLGIFFTDGYFWHVQRRFAFRYMRDNGFGRRDGPIEAVLSSEIKEMIDMALNGPKYPAEKELVNGDLLYLPHYFAAPFINGMLHVYSRMTLPRPDYHVLWNLARHTLLFQRSSDDIGRALVLTPWLKDIVPNWSGYNGLRKGNQHLLDFFTKLVEEAMATYNENFERHFIDTYIKKMKEEQKQGGRTTYSVEQLRLILVDFMFPAATAVESVLTMLVERMLLQPEIQDKIHEEIDRVIGRDRLPTLDDRQNLPYTEACIREAMRFDTLVPLGVPHRAMEKTKIAGYDVPQDTFVSANYVTLHMNKDIWGDPENFRPERFLVNGKIDLSLDKSLPFGAGRRLCAGETYARQFMFQVLASFLQTFHISTKDGKPLQKPSKRIQGIITSIPEFWVKATPRT